LSLHKIEIEVAGERRVIYEPQTDPDCNQDAYHASEAQNLLALGTRNTGKSYMMRWDAYGRCLRWAGYKVLFLRRKLTDLRKSHLQFVDAECRLFGARYRQTTFDVTFGNGSFIQFSHCETDADINNYLSSQWDLIVFDELSTFTLEQFLKICAAARTVVGKPYRALVRAGSNPLGPGADWM